MGFNDPYKNFTYFKENEYKVYTYKFQPSLFKEGFFWKLILVTYIYVLQKSLIIVTAFILYGFGIIKNPITELNYTY